ncbi:MAG: twin-arginine translocase subunit TatB [Deltaproteobacteria bacterium HGW-Deltaproteobacteria-4]|nr:MAG: twin-arginine translocase subunit TatB [Deltaproteobacteria bacterium HGW-Deltaproteobacteria-4]
MFGLGVGEILLILALALIFIGPEKLPDLARSLAKGYAEFRRSYDEVKNSIEKDMRSLNVEEHLRQGKRNLEDIYKTPWEQEPGKLTPPNAVKVEEAEVTTAPPEPVPENSVAEKKTDATEQQK